MNNMLEACYCKTTHRYISIINISIIVTINLISTKIIYNYLTINRDSTEILSTLLTLVKISLYDHLLFIKSKKVKKIIIIVIFVSL